MKIVFLLLSVLLVEGARLPASFRKCNRRQADLKQCVLEAAQDAVPQLVRDFKEISLPSLKPLKVAEATVKKGRGTVAVDQNFRDCDLYGFDQVHFDDFEFDFEKKTLMIAGRFEKIDMRCKYNLSGKVLLLPIEGEGPGNIILNGLSFKCLLHYDEVKKHSKTYFKFVSNDLDINPSLVYFEFQNLFNGDKALGDNINKVLNDNWKEVFEDVKDDYTQLVNSILLSLINGFFSKVSLEEAFD